MRLKRRSFASLISKNLELRCTLKTRKLRITSSFSLLEVTSVHHTYVWEARREEMEKNTESKNEALFVPCYNIMHYGTTWQQFVRTLFKNTIILFFASPKCCIMKHCFQIFLRRLVGQQRLLWYFLKRDFWTYSQNHRWNSGGYLTVKLKAPLTPHHYNSYVASHWLSRTNRK